MEENNTEVIAELKNSFDNTKEQLNSETAAIINKIIAESDSEKIKDLTYLFNQNQNKKTMLRVDKLGDLLDLMADQTMIRLSKKPDEISNQELLQGLKVIQDIVERGQKQVITPVTQQPLIQVNQQTNEVNINNSTKELSRESRQKIKNVVNSILNNVVDNSVENNYINTSNYEIKNTETEDTTVINKDVEKND